MTGTSCIVVGFSFANEVGCRVLCLFLASIWTDRGHRVNSIHTSSHMPRACRASLWRYLREIYIPRLSIPSHDVYRSYDGCEIVYKVSRYDLICGLTVIILIITFLHQVTFTSGTFYLALFYQVIDNSYHTSIDANLNVGRCWFYST